MLLLKEPMHLAKVMFPGGNDVRRRRGLVEKGAGGEGDWWRSGLVEKEIMTAYSFSICQSYLDSGLRLL